MIRATFAAPTGILDDHELATMWNYQPVHAGWISPLDAMVRKAYLARQPKVPAAVPMPPQEVPATAGTSAIIQIPYASVSEMRGGLGSPIAAALADAPQDLTEILRLQKRQTTMQLISTGAIVVIALTAVVSAILKKG